MKPFSITRAFLLLVITIFIFKSNTFGQCAGNQPSKMVSYDTSVVGAGNNDYNFRFPKFDLTLGTLIMIKLETRVTLMYSFQLENNNLTSAAQKVRITRTDSITYPFEQIEKINVKTIGPYPLEGTDGVPHSGADYVEDGPLFAFQNLINTYIITDDTAPFLGIDSLDINYKTESFAYAIGNINSTLTGQAEDFINFKITYFYCPVAFLAFDVMQFNAIKLSSGDIQLSWLTPNNYSGKRYEIEKSADGRRFISFQSFVSGSIPSTGNQFLYHPGKEDGNRIFFRVRQFEPDGSSKYSAIRQVTLDSDESRMKVYPTLATNAINIYMPSTNKGDYKVSIISTTGQIVQQSEFSKTNLIRVPFIQKLPAGLYMVAVYNKHTMESQQAKIVVQ